MSGASKLNNIGMAKSQHQQDMEALQAGAMHGGSLAPKLYQDPAEANKPPVDKIPVQAGETPEEAVAPGQAAANTASSDPGVQDKLNMMAKARAKFYGEGT